MPNLKGQKAKQDLRMKSIISPHWMQGGSAITNFRPEQLKLYGAAIAAHPEFQLEISDQPIASDRPVKGYFSLHSFDEPSKDLGPFWDTFWKLESTN